MLDIFEKYILKEGAALKQAPVAFVLAILAAGSLIWYAMGWRYAGQIESLEGRIRLQAEQIADYKEKLNGATPEEARKRIQALELKLLTLAPRQLTAQQKESLKNILSNAPVKGTLIAAEDSASFDAPSFVGAIEKVFIASGWERGGSLVEVPAINNPPKTGLALVVLDKATLTSEEAIIKQAFEVAGIEFEVRADAAYSTISQGKDRNVVLLVTSKATQ